MSGLKASESQLIGFELSRLPKPSLALEEEVNQALWTYMRQVSALPNLPQATLRNSKTLVAELTQKCPEVLVDVMRSAWIGSAVN